MKLCLPIKMVMWSIQIVWKVFRVLWAMFVNYTNCNTIHVNFLWNCLSFFIFFTKDTRRSASVSGQHPYDCTKYTNFGGAPVKIGIIKSKYYAHQGIENTKKYSCQFLNLFDRFVFAFLGPTTTIAACSTGRQKSFIRNGTNSKPTAATLVCK